MLTLTTDRDNIIISDGVNHAAFELCVDDMYVGHYFFEVRGRDAINLGLQIIDMFFKETQTTAIRGLTPLTNLKARWMSRQLGFKGYGVVSDGKNMCELFILTRNEWNTKMGLDN